jgi:hypothetical protein
MRKLFVSLALSIGAVMNRDLFSRGAVFTVYRIGQTPSV